ncbi:MAG: hypothetical protein U9P72_01815 [Campylobacterota bacterium]|nr:hypothetical protein [Campylobacterota bacterium]
MTTIKLSTTYIKTSLFSLLLILSFSACQDSKFKENKETISIIGGKGVNPNSLAYRSANDQKNRENKVEISKIDSNTKIEIAKIESNNQLLIAKVNANTQKEVAKTDSTTKIQTSQIDALTKKDDIQSNLYITITIILALVIAVYLLYLNNKKNRELKNKLHQDKLKHEQMLKEREHEENRLHKMLELVEKGKLSPDMEAEVISSLTKPKQNLLTSE